MLQLNVTEHAIQTFDRMLGVSSAGHKSAQISQRQTAPVQQSADAAHQGVQALAVQSGEWGVGSAWKNALCKNRTTCMSLGYWFAWRLPNCPTHAGHSRYLTDLQESFVGIPQDLSHFPQNQIIVPPNILLS